MKILLVNDHIHFGGGGDAVLAIEREYLKQEGHDVYSFSWGKEEKIVDNYYICKESSHRTLTKYNKFISARKMGSFFKKCLKEVNPDVIHIHLISKYPLAIYPYLKKQRVVQTLHGPNLFCSTSWGCVKHNSAPCEMGIGYKCYYRGCCSMGAAALYTNLSLRLKKYLTSYVSIFHSPSRNIHNTAIRLGFKSTYIPLGMDRAFQDLIPAPHRLREKNILFVGAMCEAKGVDILYTSFKRLCNQYNEWKLVFAGGGERVQALHSLIKDDGLENRVLILGKIPHEEIIGLYNSCSILAVPSIWQEQFALVGPEALACGVPVIGSNIGGIPEWLHHNEWGYLTPPRSADDITKYLKLLMDDCNLRDEMGGKGRAFVLKEYENQKYLSCIARLLISIANNRSYDFAH